MPKLSGPTIIEIQDAYAAASSTSGMALGQKAVTKDGKTFRWAKVGGSPLVAGNVLQSPANDTNFNGMAVQANVAAGATVIPVTLGGSATTAGQFVGGTLTVRSGTSMLGYTYTIVAHDVQASTSGTCNFTVAEPVLVALTTSATVTVRKNPYDGVIQSPATTLTGTPVGVAPQVMAASTYGWIQTGGPCAVLTADTTAVGLSLMVPSGTAGAAIAQTAGNIILGQTMEVAANAVTTMVNLSLN